uniref:RNA helicase n=1 Tax=Albugo laibachii Nc14 TaxID=890382 RepID=F0W953_9STRA|nr:hypothetical protein BRAFLDRAFT_265555 [Albugo laibachii Nc14]|eukprot:CCA17666.1 hypothetical protein BRAFLDRAFT_265555 [Albugo laibachii Nc14]
MNGTNKHKRRKSMVQSLSDSDVKTSATSLLEESTDSAIDTCTTIDPASILSEELQSELCVNETDSIILHKKEKKKDDKLPEKWIEEAKKMSKAKRKKLQQLALQKTKQTQRAHIFKSLQENQLGDEQQKIMFSSSNLGHTDTVRERLQRSLRMEKLGLQLTAADFDLLHPKEVRQEYPIASNSTPRKLDSAHMKGDKAPLGTKVADSKGTGSKKKTKKRVRAIFTSKAITTSDEFQTPAHTKEQVETSTVPIQEVVEVSEAMTRLLELRKKNQERRLKESSKSIDPSTQEDRVEPKYIPTIIPLKTTRELQLENRSHSRPLRNQHVVQLQRRPEIQMARMQLPVCTSEQEIMEAIANNEVVILCGETGSGKTTQVPQFLYEAGFGHPEHPTFFGRIGVTQPRRVATVSTAKRVAEELNVGFGEAPGGHVGYQIRYDSSHFSKTTRIKFMTDGILLKEIQQDFLLRQYSVIILDEAHERNINTDILIGLLSRIVPFRSKLALEEMEEYRALTPEEQNEFGGVHKLLKPLKLVIMSATLRVEDFTSNTLLFPSPPPVLRIEARQYPVTVHFSKHTELEKYVEAAFKKVVRIHNKLPEGGVLVFLTGQQEIMQLVRKLSQAYGSKASRPVKSCKSSRKVSRTLSRDSEYVPLEHDDAEEEACIEQAQDVDSYQLDHDSDIDSDQEENDSLAVPYIHALPLYSLLPPSEQMRVFDEPPEHHRLVVVATDIAETSLTIPNIKYVVDAGRTKSRVYNLDNGISNFQIQWISKASADQRAGRAGRTGPGHCYRLYSSAVYDTDFPKFTPPEILCHPIEEVVLQMKAMGIHNVSKFPFPTPPDRHAFVKAVQLLEYLGAITVEQSADSTKEEITRLGQLLVQFPVTARFAKMLLLAKEMGVLEYTIAIVAGLSGHSPFVTMLEEEPSDQCTDELAEERRKSDMLNRRLQWANPQSDLLSLLRAAGAYAYESCSSSFCKENFLHEKLMSQMLQLRQQLTRIVNTLYAEEEGFTKIALSSHLDPPSPPTEDVLRQIIAAGFMDQVARRAPRGMVEEGSKLDRNCAYVNCTGDIKEPIYIHPHSHVFTANPSKLPEYVVYQQITRTTRAYMRNVTIIEASWLGSIGLGTSLCSYPEILEEPKPEFNASSDRLDCYVQPHYGKYAWTLPTTKIPYPIDSKWEADYYRWLAKLLLDGKVVPYLARFSSYLKRASILVLRQKFEAKIQSLPLALQRKHIHSRADLKKVWMEEGSERFLLPELQLWLKEPMDRKLAREWRHIVTE